MALFSLSIDSFVASFAIGGVINRRGGRLGLILLFGLCDTAATALGATVARSHVADWANSAGPPLVIAYGVYVLAAVSWARIAPARYALYVLPVLMSVDNLTYGAAHASAGAGIVALALLVGLVSGTFAFVGLALRDLGRHRPEAAARRNAALCLVLLVAVSLIA